MMPATDEDEELLEGQPSQEERLANDTSTGLQRGLSGPRKAQWCICGWACGISAVITALLALASAPVAKRTWQGGVAESGSSSRSIGGWLRDQLHTLPIGSTSARDWGRLEIGRRRVAKAITAMAADYGEHGIQMFESMQFHNRDYIKRKLTRLAIRPDAPFVIGFQGTSVTAGHDNFFNQSYPLVMERELFAPYKAAGIDLIVRNHAMGNNPIIPNAFCVLPQLGTDADVIVWEFSMMVAGEDPHATEIWVRSGIGRTDGKQPALMFLDGGEGARRPENDDKPTIVRKGAPPQEIESFRDAKTQTDLLLYYEEFGTHAQGMPAAVWTLDTQAPYDYETLVPKDKVGRNAPWHPGPHGHRLRGRILAYHYLRLLEEAIDDAFFAMTQSSNAVAELLEPEHHTMPAPAICHPEICTTAPNCVSTVEPWAGDKLLRCLVSPAQIRQEGILEQSSNDDWHLQLFETDIDAVNEMILAERGYLDRKYCLQGNKRAGPLTFAVESSSPGPILICNPPGSWGEMPGQSILLQEGSELRVNGQTKQWAREEWYTERGINGLCVGAAEIFPSGKHTVELTPIQDDRYIAITTLIWW